MYKQETEMYRQKILENTQRHHFYLKRDQGNYVPMLEHIKTPIFFFAGGKTDASGSMDFPDSWWSHFPNHHQTVVDGLAVLLQSPLACQVTCV